MVGRIKIYESSVSVAADVFNLDISISPARYGRDRKQKRHEYCFIAFVKRFHGRCLLFTYSEAVEKL